MAFDQKKYINDWKRENVDRIAFNVPKGGKEVLKKTAKKQGLSVNKLIIEAVEEKYKIDLTNK